jgi:hypothetical protein
VLFWKLKLNPRNRKIRRQTLQWGRSFRCLKIKGGASAPDMLMENYLRLLCNKNISQHLSTLLRKFKSVSKK